MNSKYSISIVLIFAAMLTGGCDPNMGASAGLSTTTVPVLEVEGLHYAPARQIPDIYADPPTPDYVAPKPKPAIATHILGKSRQERTISLTVFGKTGPTLLVFAGIHGNEPQSVAVAKKFIAELRSKPSLFAKCRVGVIPCASPDGLAANSRYNNAGVDVNRNFPARSFVPSRRYGSKAASEPETRCILSAMAYLKPVAVVSIHTCDRRRRGSTIDRHGNNWDGRGKPLADAMGRANRYRCFGEWHNKTPGSFGSYAGRDKNLCVVTLEIPNDISRSNAWTANRKALLEAIRYTRSKQ
jgi:protein MpaA